MCFMRLKCHLNISYIHAFFVLLFCPFTSQSEQLHCLKLNSQTPCLTVESKANLHGMQYLLYDMLMTQKQLQEFKTCFKTLRQS